MSEQEPLSHFNIGIWLDCLPTALLIQAQIEGERRSKLQAKAEDFARRYPYGVDHYGLSEIPKRDPITHIIPAWFKEIYRYE